MWRWTFALVLLALPAWGDDGVTLIGQGGSEVVLRPTGDEVLLLHFWATWCPTCAKDLAHLQNAASECPTGSVRIFAVNVGEGETQIAEFMQRNGLELAVLRDPRGSVWRKFDGRGLPTNLFWSSARQWTEVGPKSDSAWREAMRSAGCDARQGELENSPEP